MVVDCCHVSVTGPGNVSGPVLGIDLFNSVATVETMTMLLLDARGRWNRFNLAATRLGTTFLDIRCAWMLQLSCSSVKFVGEVGKHFRHSTNCLVLGLRNEV